MIKGYEGKKTRLVPLDFDRHFENAFAWINDPECTQWIAGGDYPISRLAEKDWFEQRQRDGESAAFFAIETLEGEHIGFSSLIHIEPRHGTATSGSMIGIHEHRGKGNGSDAARVRAYYAFEVLNLRMIFSGYIEGNERSKRMQEAVGYGEWGRQYGALWKRGAYRDHVHTVLTRDRWRELSRV
jgi:RimJ/RimL family protein N-acetyltransferase